MLRSFRLLCCSFNSGSLLLFIRSQPRYAWLWRLFGSMAAVMVSGLYEEPSPSSLHAASRNSRLAAIAPSRMLMGRTTFCSTCLLYGGSGGCCDLCCFPINPARATFVPNPLLSRYLKDLNIFFYVLNTCYIDIDTIQTNLIIKMRYPTPQQEIFSRCRRISVLQFPNQGAGG